MLLTKIIEHKKKEVEAAGARTPLEDLKKRAGSICVRSAFKKSISRKGHVNLIAEIKKSSPSRGLIRPDFDPLTIALSYQGAGAAAISVLTDERFFDGKLEYLKNISERMTVPILRKDFIIDEYQVYEAAVNGAEAVLLIAHILTHEELKRLYDLARELGMEVLLEVHNEEEVDKALSANASIIGINNRDLNTFEVDISTTERLIHKIPENKVIVSESGIGSYEQIMFLKSLGVNAVLVGESLMRADNPADMVRRLMKNEL